MTKLTNITLSGYKSIEKMSLELRPLNVLIGPNGGGKSNFVSFFKLLNEMVRGKLQLHIGTSGGADGLLFYGAGTTQSIETTLTFEIGHPYAVSTYFMRLRFAAPETLAFAEERIEYAEPNGDHRLRLAGEGQRETGLSEALDSGSEGAESVVLVLDGCHAFQFHDTSTTSPMRRSVYIHDNRQLHHDGGNLAAILHKLRQTQETVYRRIVQTIRQIAPWFDDFAIDPLELDKNSLLLNWREKNSDLVFGPHQLSDGSLRAMALITLLLQPRDDLPSVIVIDEPELGLHPHAMVILACLIKAAACHCQIVVATQSTGLLDQFEAEDVIVVDRDDRASVFKRLNEEELTEWLEDYSLSELWEKNVLGGGPV